jgi:hypothetical protein
MNEGQPIRDLVWDYVYGLLSPEENREMVARIKSDPQVARLYAEVRLKGELVAEAALVEDSSLNLSPEGVSTKPQVEPARTAGKKSAAASKRNANWLSVVAASALAVLLAAGFLWPRPDERLLALNFVCADVVAPSSLPAGLTNQVVVNTFRVNASGDAEQGATAAVQLRLVDRAGKEQFQKSLQTNEEGQAMVEIPGAALEPGVKLEVLAAVAQNNSQSLALTAELPVEPEPQIAYSLSAEPEVDAAKEVPVSIWNFAAFSSKPTPADEAESINQLSDARLRDSGNRNLDKGMTAGVASTTSRGQQFGARAAGRAVGGQLRAENRAKQEQASQQVPQVVEAGQPVQVDISPALAGKTLDVSVMCRGVTVAEATDTDDSGARANTADRKAQSGQRQVTVALPPEADGLLEVEVFDQASDEPEPVQKALLFREPLKKLQVELSDFRERVPPGAEVEVKLKVTDEKGQPAANIRLGVRVWNERLVKQLGERPLLVTDAVRNSATSDYVSSENAAAETLALSQANRADLTRLTQQSKRYQRALSTPPGAPVAGEDLQRRQMNESQQMARSVAANPKIELASNRKAVKMAVQTASDEAEASRRRAIRLLGMMAMVGGAVVLILIAALAALRVTSGAKTLALPLVTALASLLIGTAWLGWLPDRSTTQIAMVERAETSSALPEPSSISADAVVNSPVPTTASAPQVAEPAARRARGPEAPAETPLAATSAPQPTATPLSAAPLSASAGLAGGGIPAPGGFAAGKAEDGEKAKEGVTQKVAEKKMDDSKGNAGKPTTPPPSLYFNPNLETDANGIATVRFTMPAVPSEYRLLIDAIGQGRIGSRQQLIVAE